MPGPSSVTTTATKRRPVWRDVHLDVGSSAYFNAFSTRLATICASRSGSRSTGSGVPGTTEQMHAEVAGLRRERLRRVTHDFGGVAGRAR